MYLSTCYVPGIILDNGLISSHEDRSLLLWIHILTMWERKSGSEGVTKKKPDKFRYGNSKNTRKQVNNCVENYFYWSSQRLLPWGEVLKCHIWVRAQQWQEASYAHNWKENCCRLRKQKVQNLVRQTKLRMIEELKKTKAIEF